MERSWARRTYPPELTNVVAVAAGNFTTLYCATTERLPHGVIIPHVIVSPSTWSGFSLQETWDLGVPWSDALGQPLSDGQHYRITVPTTASPKYSRARS